MVGSLLFWSNLNSNNIVHSNIDEIKNCKVNKQYDLQIHGPLAHLLQLIKDILSSMELIFLCVETRGKNAQHTPGLLLVYQNS